jgi:hypothetical protein
MAKLLAVVLDLQTELCYKSLDDSDGGNRGCYCDGAIRRDSSTTGESLHHHQRGRFQTVRAWFLCK